MSEQPPQDAALNSRALAVYTLAVGWKRAYLAYRAFMTLPDPSDDPASEEPSEAWNVRFTELHEELHRLEKLYESALEMAIEIEDQIAAVTPSGDKQP
jgi:hypothetical protein